MERQIPDQGAQARVLQRDSVERGVELVEGVSDLVDGFLLRARERAGGVDGVVFEEVAAVVINWCLSMSVMDGDWVG